MHLLLLIATLLLLASNAPASGTTIPAGTPDSLHETRTRLHGEFLAGCRLLDESWSPYQSQILLGGAAGWTPGQWPIGLDGGWVISFAGESGAQRTSFISDLFLGVGRTWAWGTSGRFAYAGMGASFLYGELRRSHDLDYDHDLSFAGYARAGFGALKIRKARAGFEARCSFGPSLDLQSGERSVSSLQLAVLIGGARHGQPHLGQVSQPVAADRYTRGGFWAGWQGGHGSLHRSSSESPSSKTDCFTMAFKLGYTPVPPVRLGIELGGWLVEAGNLNNPEKGEGLAQYNLILQVYPRFVDRLYLRAGGGPAVYWNNHPLQFGSSGWGGTLGAGYEIPVERKVSVTPEFHYSEGTLADVNNPIVKSTHRRYHAVTISLGFTYR